MRFQKKKKNDYVNKNTEINENPENLTDTQDQEKTPN